MSTHAKVQLISSDKKIFEVEACVIQQSELLKKFMEGKGTGRITVLCSASSTILTKVTKYCQYHANFSESSTGKQVAPPKEEIEQWDANFCNVDYPTLASLIKAAHYLQITSLLHLACQAVADMITDKTAQEIRDTFNIGNDFS